MNAAITPVLIALTWAMAAALVVWALRSTRAGAPSTGTPGTGTTSTDTPGTGTTDTGTPAPDAAALARRAVEHRDSSLWAARRERRRRARCETELSHALGEMVMGIEAGLTLEMVMALYAERHRSDLAAEFQIALDQIALGMSRTEAMEDLGRRTPTPEMHGFVTAVQHNQRIGTPLAEILRRHAHTARRRRRQNVEEQAATLSLKMIFPTVFCILPVLLLVIVGPALVRLLAALPG